MKVVWFLLSTLISPILTKGHPHLGIVNGESAEITDVPYAVAIWSFNLLLDCGGSIIADKWVLTAAHCVMERNYQSVTYGTTNCEDTIWNNRNKVINYYRHPDFKNFDNDVGLLQVQSDFKFGDNVKPVKLPTLNQEIPYNKMTLMVGCGVDQYENAVTKLYKLLVKINSNDFCSDKLENFNSTKDICAGEKGSGACSGDSGSGLVGDGVIFAIVSSVRYPCGNNPFFVMGVARYMPWIEKETGISQNLIG